MRKTSGMKSVVFLYVFFAVLLAGAILAAAIYTTHISTIVRPDGEVSRSSWPQQYAESFDRYISVENDIPAISVDGISSLDRNQLWVQILDGKGNQVTEHNRPDNIPTEYSLSELLDLAASGSLDAYTVSVISFADGGQSYEYIVGFPIGITKITTYYNSDRFTGSRPIVLMALTVVGIVVIVAGLVYGIWLTKHLSRIVKSSGEIATRTYMPKRAKGAFGDAYKSLNKLDAEIHRGDEVRAEAERMQEEWITSITHDLKAPLSPIRGYAELLADPAYSLSDESRIQYGNTILRNTEHAEKLVNDLKLTYQLNNNMLPIDMKEASLTRFLKETVIKILNHPEYSKRDITFTEADKDVLFRFDGTLLKRAIDNLIYNALIHNDKCTEIHVALQADEHITISIDDNGKGMSNAQMNRLFERYYRGTNTQSSTEGTGLGMVIAKQIIEIHGGAIDVDSAPGKGTHIKINLPLTNLRLK